MPRKNLMEIGGRSLVARSVDAAVASGVVQRVIVSTDDPEIRRHVRGLDVELHERPVELAGDESPVVDTVRLVRQAMGLGPSTIMVLLQPTSPLREPESIRHTANLVRRGWDSAATFVEATLHPHQAFVNEDGSGARPFDPHASPWVPRQRLMPPAIQLAGSVYAFGAWELPTDSVGVLFGRIGVVMVSAAEAIDVDTPLDLEVARALAAVRDSKPGGEW